MTPALSAASAVAAPALHLRDGCAHGVSRYAVLDNCMNLLYHIPGIRKMVRKDVSPCRHTRITQAAGTAPFTTRTGPANAGRRKKRASPRSVRHLSGSGNFWISTLARQR